MFLQYIHVISYTSSLLFLITTKYSSVCAHDIFTYPLNACYLINNDNKNITIQ